MRKRYCSGIRLKALIQAGIKHLGLHKTMIDSLNVFPNPDGNTGENMYRTLLAGWGRVQKAPSTHAGRVMDEFFTGSFFGARGVSGFIFAKFIEGFARAVRDKNVLYPEDVVNGFAGSARLASQDTPGAADGTMLNVADAAYESSSSKLKETAALEDVLKAAHEGAHEALLATREESAILKNAGAVDAGGLGLLVFIEGMFRYSARAQIAVNDEYGAFRLRAVPVKNPYRGYCAEFLLKGDDLSVEELSGSMGEIAESLFVFDGGGGHVKVHLHTADPKRVFDRTARFGRILSIKVDDIGELEDEFLSGLSIEGHLAK